MKLLRPFAWATCIALAPAAHAAPVTLTFEGVGDLQSVGSAYDSLGISFSSSSIGLVNGDNGGSGNFENQKLPGFTVLVSIGAPAILSREDGFDTALSFFYSAAVSGSISVYDDVKGQGNRLASTVLSSQSASNCPIGSTEPFCNFDEVSLTFGGLGKSIVFTGGTQILYDNVTINAVTAPGGVPEPATIALVLAALGGSVAASRRRRA